MRSEYRITQISQGDAPAIHSYFDLPPESPDGERVVYFAFLESPPGLGQIKVASRDGRRQQAFEPSVYGSAHHAVLQQWIDTDSVAYSVIAEDEPATVILALRSGSRRRLPCTIRMFSAANGMGLCDPSVARARGFKETKEAISLVDLRSREVRPLFTREEVFEIHPWRDTFDDLEHVHFRNSKWSPDGRRFFTVYANDDYVRQGSGAVRMKSLIVADAADGYRPRYLTEFGHHPMWERDGSFVYAYSPSPEGKQDLVAYPFDGSAAYPLVKNMPGTHATISPDGRSILTDVYHWGERGKAAVILFDIESKKARELVSMNAPDTSHGTGCHLHPVYSRDGERIYFNSNDTGVAHLYALDL